MAMSTREQRLRRKRRYASKNRGTAERPRLSVFRSARHIYAQIIDDVSGKTLAAASTRDKAIATGLKGTGNVEAAEKVGESLAQKSTAAGVKQVIFDKGGFLYHGRVKALADGARKGGLEF